MSNIIISSSDNNVTENNLLSEWKQYLRKSPQLIHKRNNSIEQHYPYETWANNDPRWQKVLPSQATCLQHDPDSILLKIAGSYDPELDRAIESGLPISELEPIITERVPSISSTSTLLHTQAMLIQHQTTYTKPSVLVDSTWDTLTAETTAKPKQSKQQTMQPAPLKQLAQLIDHRIWQIEKSKKNLEEDYPSTFFVDNEEEVVGQPITENAISIPQQLLLRFGDPRIEQAAQSFVQEFALLVQDGATFMGAVGNASDSVDFGAGLTTIGED